MGTGPLNCQRYPLDCQSHYHGSIYRENITGRLYFNLIVPDLNLVFMYPRVPPEFQANWVNPSELQMTGLRDRLCIILFMTKGAIFTPEKFQLRKYFLFFESIHPYPSLSA